MSQSPPTRPLTLCQVCGRRTADSREHVPAWSVGNAGPVRVRHTGLRPAPGGGVAHGQFGMPDGFTLRVLCARCNNRLGSRYGTAYADFAAQFAASGRLTASDGRVMVSLRGIYPARIAKQMVLMFLAAQPRATPGDYDGLRRFVLDKHAPLPAGALDLYLYRNPSTQGRIVPVCCISELRRPDPRPDDVLCCSEVSWPPVGVVYALHGGARLAAMGMTNVTAWAGRRFDAAEDVLLHVPDLPVATDWPLGFGSAADVERWTRERGVIWAIAKADDEDAPNAVSMLWTRERSAGDRPGRLRRSA